MMTYTHVLKVVYRNLRQTQLCFSLHALRTASTAPGWLGLRKNVPSLSCFTSAQRHQVLSFHCSARNRGEDRGKSVSRYQSGTPKPSAAQKGTQGGDMSTVTFCPWTGYSELNARHCKIPLIAFGVLWNPVDWLCFVYCSERSWERFHLLDCSSRRSGRDRWIKRVFILSGKIWWLTRWYD